MWRIQRVIYESEGGNDKSRFEFVQQQGGHVYFTPWYIYIIYIVVQIMVIILLPPNLVSQNGAA